MFGNICSIRRRMRGVFMRKEHVKVRSQKAATIFIIFAIMSTIIGFIFWSSIKAEAASAELSYKYYTSIQVQKGDTLWDIANAYMTGEYEDVHAYMDEVCAINHISKDDIYSGRYLTVPYYADTYME